MWYVVYMKYIAGLRVHMVCGICLLTGLFSCGFFCSGLQVWRFASVGGRVCSWEPLGAADELHRYEQVMVVGDGSQIVVHGGHQDGITGSAFAFPIG